MARTEHKRWRWARFPQRESCAEFLSRAQSLGIPEIEVEALDEVGVRFSAPTALEVGVACMVDAHGGRVMPSVDPWVTRRTG